MKFFYLFFLSVILPTHSLAKSELDQHHNFKLTAQLEQYHMTLRNQVNGYNEIKNRNYDYSGRQQRVKHHDSSLQLPSVSLLYQYKKTLSLGVQYGNNNTTFSTTEKNQSAPGLFNHRQSQILTLFCELANFKIESRNLDFKNGTLELYDVSTDPLGEAGTLTNSYQYNAKINEVKLSYQKPLFNMKAYSFDYFNPVLLIGRYRYPSIPYLFQSSAGGNTFSYQAESSLQNIDMRSTFAGLKMGVSWLSVEALWGMNQYNFLDNNNHQVEIRNKSALISFSTQLDRQIDSSLGEINLSLGLEHTHYLLSDVLNDQVEDSTGQQFFEVDAEPSLTRIFFQISLDI